MVRVCLFVPFTQTFQYSEPLLFHIQMRVNSSDPLVMVSMLAFLILIIGNNQCEGATSPVAANYEHSSSALYEEHAELITEIVEVSVKKDEKEEILKFARKSIVTLLKLVPEVGDGLSAAVDGIISVGLYYPLYFTFTFVLFLPT